MDQLDVISLDVPTPQRSVASLLDLEPDLGAGLPPDALRAARARLGVTVELLPRGPWDPEEIPVIRRGAFGVLVIEGLLAREVCVAGGGALELFGPSDLANPWATDQPAMLVTGARWSVVEAARIAVIDPRATKAIGALPSVLNGATRRLAERGERLAVHQAIAQLPRVEQRLLTMLWFVAERWGHVTPSGVSVILPLSHSGLGRLIGARRPTVSLALKDLDAQNLVHRQDDGTWLLPGRPPESVTGVKRKERVVAVRRLSVEPKGQSLAERIVALRRRYERNLQDAAEVIDRSQAARNERRRLVSELSRRSPDRPAPPQPAPRG